MRIVAAGTINERGGKRTVPPSLLPESHPSNPKHCFLGAWGERILLEEMETSNGQSRWLAVLKFMRGDLLVRPGSLGNDHLISQIFLILKTIRNFIFPYGERFGISDPDFI